MRALTRHQSKEDTMDVGDAALIGLVVGIVCGLIPLVSGFVKGRVALGLIGFAASAVAGVILGLLLALPVAIIFTLAIFLMRGERQREQHA